MDNINITVTVLMPVYNGEPYLRESITSILGQSYINFEFLIIDDGSTDDSLDIIRSFGDKRIRVITNEANIGIVESLNKGISSSIGKYIVRMDCDDVSLPTRIGKLVSYMESNPNIGVCGSWIKLIGADKKDIWRYPSGTSATHARMLFEDSLAHPSVIIRKQLLIDNSLHYSSDYPHAEDYGLWTEIIRYSQLNNIQEVLLLYRVHDRSIGRTYNKVQNKSANKIRVGQLKELGIELDKYNVELHHSISSYKFLPTRFYVINAKHWLEQLFYANNNSHFYPDYAFRIELAQRWWLICRNAISLGPWIVITFLMSPLSKYADMSFLQKIIFLIKSILKWKNILTSQKYLS